MSACHGATRTYRRSITNGNTVLKVHFTTSPVTPGILQSVIFGGYVGASTAAIFNLIGRRFG